MDIDRIGPDEVERVIAASALFDGPATDEWTTIFLTSPGHHLLLARLDGADVGFITGVETTHPDKGTELFLYELGVDESARQRGVGRALVTAMGELARERGCYGMWVSTELDNDAAIATYRSAGADVPEPGVVLAWTFEP
jgi:ribosomal protein S18 acetylase RimI-like enzyme